MPKPRSHKRQKTEKLGPQPLGTTPHLIDDSNKDDEERRLESLLFGTQYASGSTRKSDALVISDDEEADVGGNELQTLLDSEVPILLVTCDASVPHTFPALLC